MLAVLKIDVLNEFIKLVISNLLECGEPILAEICHRSPYPGICLQLMSTIPKSLTLQIYLDTSLDRKN